MCEWTPGNPARSVDNRGLPSCQDACAPSAGTEITEALALFRQPLEKRRGRPGLAVTGVEGRHVGVDLLEPDLVGVEHGAAAVAREAVAVEVGDVDVARAKRDALLEDARALVDERPEAAREHLVVADRAPRDAAVFRASGDDRLHRGIGLGRARAGLVAVPSGGGLLAEAPLLAEPIAHMRVAQVLPARGGLALADAPADIEPRQVLHGERAHGEAEIVDDLVDLLGRRALLDEELRLAEIRVEHAVADEAVAVTRQHPDLADPPRQLGGG